MEWVRKSTSGFTTLNKTKKKQRKAEKMSKEEGVIFPVSRASPTIIHTVCFFAFLISFFLVCCFVVLLHRCPLIKEGKLCEFRVTIAGFPPTDGEG